MYQSVGPTYTEISGGHDVIESTYAVAYANTGPSDIPMYDPLIVPTLPISLDDFKHHVTNCHLKDDSEFYDQYQVLVIKDVVPSYMSFAC